MKTLVTVYELNHLEKLLTYADGFLIGNDRFGTRLTHSFSNEEIFEAIKIAEKLNKSCFLVANQMFDDEQLSAFEKWLKELPIHEFKGIIITDLGALAVLEKLGCSNLAVYHPETLLTNHFDFNFLEPERIKGAVVAKEITLANVIDIAKHKAYKLFMVGHGHLSMFYSKRQLVHNFMDFTHLDRDEHNSQNLRLVEENRKEEQYPILEDQAGTHVFRNQVFASLDHIIDLKPWIDYLIIDTIFKDDAYGVSILKLYQSEHPDPKKIEELKHKYNETWDEGFFFKKTIYKQKG